MENKNKIIEELKQVCPALSEVENKTPYNILPSYFENLPDILVEKVKMVIELPNCFTTQNPYKTPEGYFESLPADIGKKVGFISSKKNVFEEMESISPLLNTLNKSQVYSVSKDYFETLDYNMPTDIVGQSKIAYFTVFRNILNYAAAAAVIGILAVGIFFFIGKSGINNNSAVRHAKSLNNVKSLSEQEIVNFLKNNSPQEHIVTNNNRVSASGTENGDIKKMISEMSDKEIKQFLRENGEYVEM